MKIRTNVKLNLGLSVLGKRADGYHDLETLFIPYYGLGDWLEIEEAPSFGVSVEPCSWDPMTDLSVRAYKLLRHDFDLPPVRIRLEKGAPVGAGLGGGSADAAFALKLLSELFGLGLTDEALASYAARLGSDCPFFVYNRPMLAKGRGELLTPFGLDLSGYEIRVVVPEGISVSTREAYSGVIPRGYGSAVESARSGSAGDRFSAVGSAAAESAGIGNPGAVGPLSGAVSSASEGVSSGEKLIPLEEALSRPVEEWRGCLVNDFERSVFALHPELAQLKERLYAEGAVYAAMSGSGSALFGLWKKS